MTDSTEHAPNSAEQVPAKQAAVEDRLVEEVLTSFDNTPDPRRKQVMQSLPRHLHFLVTAEGWSPRKVCARSSRTSSGTVTRRPRSATAYSGPRTR
ncbi:hypothetical protein [Haloactinomyces albus]|uniref:Uncharacterized protein n=1 Tax=Haloactinomyces albus TaxID=1352928 RepID=A0AAE3ZF75_9ACTN|nr:hypothetical protein [Haloactinomyces albus]MDR7303797.1 hypothetical protein [Haloactinomyces albus]